MGVALFDGADAGPTSLALLALTMKVYAMPLSRPETRIELHGAVQVPDNPPGVDIAV